MLGARIRLEHRARQGETVTTSPLSSPVVLDPSLSDEKLAELLGHQTEYPDLDYKTAVDLTSTEDLVELTKDVGAMQVRGGYIVIGADNQGALTGAMDGVDTRPFDEANLTPKLLRYLPKPLELRTRVLEREGHTVVMIYVGRHPSGCAIFNAVGQYPKGKETVVVFRAGDIFWRDGTRSVRMTQQGFEELVERRIADEKAAWLEEQQVIRRQEQADLQTSYEAQRISRSALGSVNLDLDTAALTSAALELVRDSDTIALQNLLKDARTRARAAIERDEIETELANVVDKLTCLAATFLEYEQEGWFDRVVGILAEIYSMPLGEHDARRFGHATSIDPAEPAPRVWLLLITRVYGLGALAVRLRNWRAVRTLTLQLPERLEHAYDANWLRHALTMASRAQHLEERGQHANLLSLARDRTKRLACLRPDGLEADNDVIITSLAQFDVLSNIAAIDDASDTDPRVFWPNFSQFRQERIQPMVDRLLTDREMRQALFRGNDAELATAFSAIENVAHGQGLRYDGFESWARTPVGTFIENNTP
jgi:hypothetical protein